MYSQLDEQKNEAAMRLRYDAANGPGSALKAYATEVARRISATEKFTAISGAGSATALALANLREKGLDAQQKLATLRVLSGRAAAAALSAPSPVASPAPVPTTAILASVALTPPPAPTAPAAVDPYPLSAEYENIEDPIDRTLFIRANRVQMASEDRRRARDEAAIKPSKQPTCTGSLISQLASISDPASRVRWYREHKSEVDAEYSRLSQKQ